jgi:hypothetical protein
MNSGGAVAKSNATAPLKFLQTLLYLFYNLCQKSFFFGCGG